jgi:hypothetical protein
MLCLILEYCKFIIFLFFTDVDINVVFLFPDEVWPFTEIWLNTLWPTATWVDVLDISYRLQQGWPSWPCNHQENSSLQRIRKLLMVISTTINFHEISFASFCYCLPVYGFASLCWTCVAFAVFPQLEAKFIVNTLLMNISHLGYRKKHSTRTWTNSSRTMTNHRRMTRRKGS